MRNTGESSVIRRHRREGSLRTNRAAPRSGCRRRYAKVQIALAAGVLALGGLLQVPPAQAIEFGAGEFQGNLDTTVSHGVTARVGRRDDVLAAGTNDNDGNLNYDRGIVSNASKFTSDVDVRIGNFGAFARVTGFFDFENENGNRERTPLSDEAKDRLGKNVDLLDLYATGAFDVGGAALDLRLGRHVLNWGESTFIQNGINAINPIDVSRLRTPGSELREALVPVSMFSAAAAPTETLSVEGFYQFDWRETEIDPVGSYFSTTDYVGPGARRAVIPLPPLALTDRGLYPGSTTGIEPLLPVLNGYLAAAGMATQPLDDREFLNVRRGADRSPSDSGQWGFAVHHYAEELNDTEFGFYFVNYHSRLPVVSARTGTLAGIAQGLAAVEAIVDGHTRTVTPEITRRVTGQITRDVEAGLIDPDAAAARIEEEVARQVPGQLIGIAGAAVPLAIDRYVETGRYFVEYPENIRLFGLSFNTRLGTSGWALQGEYSFRPDTPLQRDESALFEDGLSPILRALDPAHPDYVGPEEVPAYVAGYRPSRVQGYVERDVSQVQATATKVFGPTFGAGSVALVAEVALMYVHAMPDKNTMPLESPAGGKRTAPDVYADATSWGYRLAAQLDYNNAVGAINLYPYAQFLHDVSGDSPAPSGPFIEGRTALTVGVRAAYLGGWQADLGYTRLAGEGNDLSDRDFISASIKYSF